MGNYDTLLNFTRDDRVKNTRMADLVGRLLSASQSPFNQKLNINSISNDDIARHDNPYGTWLAHYENKNFQRVTINPSGKENHHAFKENKNSLDHHHRFFYGRHHNGLCPRQMG
jgi:hypothetical protein